jgi:UDP-N-acetylglucosamine--N-acetylmuramyl-(pentapeptide) pyrophosphoryl-undecaprenol N-acetylglucosamine transferase
LTTPIIKVVLAGGGTGGHIIPAVAIADELSNQGVWVRFIGTKGRIEEKLVPKAGYGIDYINVRPLKGNNILEKMLAIGSVPVSVVKSAFLLKQLSADFVLGVGGYVAGPVVLAAKIMGIPTALLEQNATVGLTNKLLSRITDKAFVAYMETAEDFPEGRAFYTGNPVKQSILDASAKKTFNSSGKINILVMGGSQGAMTIDNRVPEALAVANLKDKATVLHQTKSDSVKQVEKSYIEKGIKAVTTSFIEDTASAYSAADILIARSGATTVAEACVMGLPAVFLPYPHHSDKQQEKNALPMQKAKAAHILNEQTTTIEDLAIAIDDFAGNSDKRRQAAEAARRLAKPDAAFTIANKIVQMAKKG